MTCALEFAFLYSHKTVRRATYHASLVSEVSLGEILHSRTVDEAFRPTEDEEIIEKGSHETAAARTNDRSPDPVLVTECEYCSWYRNLRYGSISSDWRPRSSQGLYGPCVPYPTIAVIMRGPRSRAGFIA